MNGVSPTLRGSHPCVLVRCCSVTLNLSTGLSQKDKIDPRPRLQSQLSFPYQMEVLRCYWVTVCAPTYLLPTGDKGLIERAKHWSKDAGLPGAPVSLDRAGGYILSSGATFPKVCLSVCTVWLCPLTYKLTGLKRKLRLCLSELHPFLSVFK